MDTEDTRTRFTCETTEWEMSLLRLVQVGKGTHRWFRACGEKYRGRCSSKKRWRWKWMNTERLEENNRPIVIHKKTGAQGE